MAQTSKQRKTSYPVLLAFFVFLLLIVFAPFQVDGASQLRRPAGNPATRVNRVLLLNSVDTLVATGTIPDLHSEYGTVARALIATQLIIGLLVLVPLVALAVTALFSYNGRSE